MIIHQNYYSILSFYINYILIRILINIFYKIKIYEIMIIFILLLFYLFLYKGSIKLRNWISRNRLSHKW